MKFGFFAAALGAVTAFTCLAGASDTSALLERGRALMKEKRFDEACPLLADSVKIQADTSARLALADCYEQSGRTNAAFAILSAAGDDAEAHRRAAALEPKLTRLAIVAKGSDTTITLDGALVTPEQLRAAQPVDPGSHIVVAWAPGRAAWSASIPVSAQPGVVTVEVPELAELAAAPVAPVFAAPSTPVAASRPAIEFPPRPGTAWWKLVSFGMGGVGLLAMGGGAIFGLESKVQWDDSNKSGHCIKDDCDAAGKFHRDQASSYRTTTTAFAASGLGFVTAGLLMYVLTPSTTVMPTIGGASLTHKF